MGDAKWTGSQEPVDRVKVGVVKEAVGQAGMSEGTLRILKRAYALAGGTGGPFGGMDGGRSATIRALTEMVVNLYSAATKAVAPLKLLRTQFVEASQRFSADADPYAFIDKLEDTLGATEDAAIDLAELLKR